MLSVVNVSVLRKHSCGEPEVCTLPSPPLHHIGDDNQVQYEPPPPVVMEALFLIVYLVLSLTWERHQHPLWYHKGQLSRIVSVLARTI